MKNNTFFALLFVCRILVIPKTHMLPLSNKTTRNKAVEVRRYIASVPVLLTLSPTTTGQAKIHTNGH
jgi:hypothetical protein